jgi:hypothetical protein
MSGAQELLLGNFSAAGGGGYQIERSLRFNSADSAYLNRTPASAGNRKTWTYSFWVKRAKLSRQMFLGVYTSSTDVAVIEIESDQIYWYDYLTSSYRYELRTTQVLRDPSAWYHIMCVLDTTQATSSNRNKIYINGSLVTALTTATYPTQNLDGKFNTAVQHSIGTEGSNLRLFLDAYQTETYFIDGQALTPSSFGFNSSDTGVWSPKQYIGSYGTNGFYLNFSDNSGTTSTTLGKDSSGNGNNWTPNNFSVTAGAGNDSLVDSPTAYGTDTGVGGEVRGNYCTLNPLDEPSTYAAAGTPVNGNLDFSVSNDAAAGATFAVSSGKWYWEMTVVSGHSAGANTIWTAITSINPSSSNKLAWQAGSGSRSYATTGLKFNENTSSSYGNTYTNGDVIGCALDLDNGKVYWSKNGTFQASGDPVAGTNAAFTGLTGTWLPEATQNAGVTAWNFGQRAFAYTAPSGFKALCTTNLPTPTIGATSTTQANDYFNTVLYTGTGSSLGVTGVGFQPDWVWIKERSGAADHGLYDAVRGVQNQLESNTTTAETTEATGLTAFGTDGFTVGALAQLNTSADTYVAWNWNAGGSTVTNTSGTISAQVRANTTSGFSIVTATAPSAAAQGTVGHGLGVTPSMIFLKTRSTTYNWSVYHASVCDTTSKFLRLNDTSALLTFSTVWGAALPTSSVFGITGDGAGAPSETFVAYCFAPVAGYSAFGSYAGNGSADGPFIYTGFRPRFVMVKQATVSARDWIILDTVRNTYNVADLQLMPNKSDAEATTVLSSTAYLDILSNGFKVRNTSVRNNENTATYIYACFAEFPFKFSLAR